MTNSMHLNAAQKEAEMYTEMIEDLSPDRLIFLIMHNPEFKRLSEWSPASVLLAELIRRLDFDVTGWTPTRDGWLKPDGSLLCYE